MKSLAAVLGAAFFMMAITTAGFGQIPIQCLTRDVMLKSVLGKYHERLAATATSRDGQFIAELYVRDDGNQSWTMAFSDGSDIWCIVAHGANWDFTFPADIPKPEPPSDPA